MSGANGAPAASPPGPPPAPPKGKGKGPPPTPPKGKGKGPPPPKAADAVKPAPAGSFEDALKSHSFRRTGVVTTVTRRADVEAAFAKLVPSRVRKANQAWSEAYGGLEAAAAAAADSGAEDHHDDRRPSKRVRFAEEGAAQEVLELEVDGGDLPCPAVWSLGAGVSKRYRESIAARQRPLGDAGAWPPLSLRHSPEVVWGAISAAQRFLQPTRVLRADDPELLPRAPGMVRFVCISDTHGGHRLLTDLLPAGDVLLHGGDFTGCGQREEVRDFGAWLGSLPFARKIVIAGNHDVSFDTAFCEELGPDGFHGTDPREAGDAAALLLAEGGASVTYLQDEEVQVQGVRIFGTPWSPEFGTWGFNQMRGPPSAAKWAEIPAGIDVLLVHGPPLGRGDLTEQGSRAGCADLLRELQGRLRPTFCVSGHVHEDATASSDGTTHFLNAASLEDSPGRPRRAPWVFDLPAR